MESSTFAKDTLVFTVGMIIIVAFGWWLRRRYQQFDFTQKFNKVFFILENYELVGMILIGMGLILIAIFG